MRVVTISIGFGLIPIVAVSLNAFFNRTTKECAERDTFLAAQAAEPLARGKS